MASIFRNFFVVLFVAFLVCEIALSEDTKKQEQQQQQQQQKQQPSVNNSTTDNPLSSETDSKKEDVDELEVEKKEDVKENDKENDKGNDKENDKESDKESKVTNINKASSVLKNITEKSHNSWLAGGSNCSCLRELSALKRDLRDEVNQRLALKAALDTYVSELYDLRDIVTGNSNYTTRPAISPNAPAAGHTPSIAFSSKLSYNRELKPLDTVIFDTVLTNDGNCYDPDTGKFTAVVTGTYIFHATILSGYNTKVETAIIVNDKEVARIYSGAHDAHGSGSNMAIVDLRSGDSVWIRLLYQGGNHVHGYYSTFSGALLKSEQ